MIIIRTNTLLHNLKIDVNFELPPQGIFAISGTSGSGKTSLLNIISGVMKTDSSYIKINDTLFQDGKTHLPLFKRQAAYIYQRPYLFPHFSVHKNLQYAWQRGQYANQISFYNDLIAKFDLLPLVEYYPYQLSGGQLHRASIVQGLLSGPKLLLMDEPFSSLDKITKKAFMYQLKKHITHYTIPTFYTSHSEHEIQDFADKVIFFHEGKVTAIEKPSAIRKIND